MKYNELVSRTVTLLARVGIDTPEIDTRRLVEEAFGLSLGQQILSGELEVDETGLATFNTLVHRRQRREPLQYILGKCEFWSMDFLVTPDVLIPRPETEFLVHHALSIVRKGYRGGPVLDMCTGSGVIAVALASELAASQVIAIDKSPKALMVAQTNITGNGRQASVVCFCSDLFGGLRRARRFELMLSNPPYIADKHMSTLQPEILDWEPESALKAGAMGLDIVERICDEALGYLLPGAWLFLEIGSDQGEAVFKLFSECGRDVKNYQNVDIINDWSGRPRVLQAQLTR